MSNMEEKLSELLKFKPSDPRFGVGPSLIPKEFIEKLGQTGQHFLGRSHRKPVVKDLVKNIQVGLKKYFNLPNDYEVLVGNGGATFLFDALSLGVVREKSLHFCCGEFSEKWYKASSLVPWIETHQESVDYGLGISPEHREPYDTICATLNETSTGVQFNKLPKRKEGTIVLVDGTSGGGQIPIEMELLDCFFFSPQKVFASEGGFFVAIVSPQFVERVENINKDHKRYIPDIMNWKTIIDNSRKNQTYNTPSISTLFFLSEQIDWLNSLGYEKVIHDSNAKANLIYEWAQNHSQLEPFVKDPYFRSLSTATIDVADKFNVNEIVKFLEKNELAFDINSYRKLDRNQFRISLFPSISLDNVSKLIKMLDLLLS